MQKRAKVIIIACTAVVAVGVLAAVAGPPIYRDLIATPAAEAPVLSANESDLSSTATAEELEAAQLDGTWVVVDGSYAGYRVDEVLNGTPVTVTGRTAAVTGQLSFTNLTLDSASFEVDVASIETDSAQRDRYFRDQALGVAEHPTAQFVLTAPVSATQLPAVGEVVEQELTGDLTIAGVTQQVTFSAQIRTDGQATEIVGQIPIIFADFGVEAPNLGFVSVEPSGYVEFSLSTAKQ